MATVFFLTKLRENAIEERYESWIKEYDYPTCKKKFGSIKFYKAYKVDAKSKEILPYDFIEHIDVTSIEEYENDLQRPEFKELLRQWSEFCDKESALIIHADVIE